MAFINTTSQQCNILLLLLYLVLTLLQNNLSILQSFIMIMMVLVNCKLVLYLSRAVIMDFHLCTFLDAQTSQWDGMWHVMLCKIGRYFYPFFKKVYPYWQHNTLTGRGAKKYKTILHDDDMIISESSHTLTNTQSVMKTLLMLFIYSSCSCREDVCIVCYFDCDMALVGINIRMLLVGTG